MTKTRTRVRIRVRSSVRWICRSMAGLVRVRVTKSSPKSRTKYKDSSITGSGNWYRVSF